MPQTLPTFADRLKDLRETAGISQYELAKRSGLSRQALSNLELGNREPTWETVRTLARALGVSVAEFDSGEPQRALGAKRPTPASNDLGAAREKRRGRSRKGK